MIRNIQDLKLVYTVLAQSRRFEFLSQEEQAHYTQAAIRHFLQNCQDAIILKKELDFVLDKAREDDLIDDFKRNLYGSELIQSMNLRQTQIENRVQELSIKVDNVENCLNAIRQHYNRNLKVKSYLGFTSAILDLFTFGIAGSAVSAALEATLCQIVDFGDMAHVEGVVGSVTENVMDKSFADMMGDGIEFVEDHYDTLDDDVVESLDQLFGEEGDEDYHAEVQISKCLYMMGVTLQIAMIDGVLAKLEKSQLEKNNLTEDEFIEVVVNKMKKHLRVAAIQNRGCMMLASLASNNHDIENKEKITFQQGTKAIVNAMNEHINNQDVQKYGCMALMNLSIFDIEQVHRLLTKENLGAVEVILRILSQYIDMVDILQYALGALMNLVVTHDEGNNREENKKKIADLEGTQELFNVIRKYPDVKKIQYYGCGTLCNLILYHGNQTNPPTYVKDNRLKVKHGGGISFIISAVEKFPDNGDFVVMCNEALAHILQ